jgi:hypothetical protein
VVALRPSSSPAAASSLDEQFTYGLDRLLDGLGIGPGDRLTTTTLTPSST